jgi:uncharacterized protein YjbJ (UPF0337 family)
MGGGSRWSSCYGSSHALRVKNRAAATDRTLSLVNNNCMEDQMNKLGIKGNWNEVAGKLKQKYANLTDDDLLFKEGKEEELLGRLQKKLGKAKEEIRDMITKL